MGQRIGRDRDLTNGVLGLFRALTVGLVRCQGWGLGFGKIGVVGVYDLLKP